MAAPQLLHKLDTFEMLLHLPRKLLYLQDTSGQSYKHFTILNYNSRVELTRKLSILQL